MDFGRVMAGLVLGWTASVCAAGEPAAPQRIPALRSESFSGVPVILPEALQGRPGILVIGFSQGSREAVTLWGTKLARAYPPAAMVPYFEMPVLASVPRVLRGFVTGRIKAAVAESEKAHFVPVLEREPEWRAVAHYAAPDDAYVLLVDGQGQVRWQTQGPPTDERFGLLAERMHALAEGASVGQGAAR